jgi:hypothetical protein
MHDRLNLVEDNLLYMIILPSKIMKKSIIRYEQFIFKKPRHI